MGFFLTGFFFIYSLLHLYLFVRARAALGLGAAACVPLALFMIVMITAPVLARLSENAGFVLFARIMAYTGYSWMAFLFLFFCASVTVDACRLVLYAAGLVVGKTHAWLALSGKSSFLLSIAIAAVVCFYGYFEARSIQSEHLTIVTSKIPERMSPLRIAQISDVHLGLVVGRGRLGRIMDRVREANPDILVSTGDLVDGQMNDMDGVADVLKAFTPRYGKFAITGNHEFYAGLGQALAFTRAAGFHVLRGEAVIVQDAINIVGVDDPAGPGYGSSSAGEQTILSAASNGKFTLFLKHRPAVDRKSARLFDLQFSGHVHDGQIFPFRLITRLFYPLVEGYYAFPPHAALYVNRGSGTWGPPIRFLSPPEVTVIDIVRPSHPPTGKKF
ncbi:MAG: metallophosphoesterase [Syntrophorhabdales bacterium]|jgi:predicted MPP superfamily phosphohydrolase